MKTPGLSGLSSRLTQKAQPAPVAESIVPEEAAPVVKRKAGAQADGRKGVLLRLKPEAWLQLKALAATTTLERGELYSMQSALEEAVNDFFRKNGKPPLA